MAAPSASTAIAIQDINEKAQIVHRTANNVLNGGCDKSKSIKVNNNNSNIGNCKDSKFMSMCMVHGAMKIYVTTSTILADFNTLKPVNASNVYLICTCRKKDYGNNFNTKSLY